MNLKETADSLGFDEDEFRSLLSIFVDTTKADLQALNDAIATGMAEQVAVAAHSIKGASASFGFSDIYEKAREIEMNARNGSLAGSTELAESIGGRLQSLISTLG